MKNALITTIVLFLLISFGCKQKPNLMSDFKDKVLDFSYIDTSSYKIIPLETNTESLIGEVYHLLFDNGYIFLLDKKKTKSIFIFDDKGKFLAKIFKEGRGPGEYIELEDFDLDRKRKEIIVYAVKSGKLMRFSYSGKFLRESKLEKIGHGLNFAYLDNNKYAYNLLPPSETQICITDSSNVIITRHNQISSKFSNMRQFAIIDFFSKNSDNSAYYIPFWSDKIYQISNNGVKEVFDFHLADFMVSSKAEMESFSSREPTGKYGPFVKLIANEANQFFANQIYNNTPVIIIGNLKTGSLIGGKIEYKDDSYKKFGLATGIGPMGHYGEFFVKVCDVKQVKRYYPEKYLHLKLTDNPCLVFYKIKI
jgi:hypothetical protein